MGLELLVHELRKLEASPQTVGLHQMPALAKVAPDGGQRHLTQVLGHRIPQCVDGVIAIDTAVPLGVAPEALHWRQLAVELGQEVAEVACLAKYSYRMDCCSLNSGCAAIICREQQSLRTDAFVLAEDCRQAVVRLNAGRGLVRRGGGVGGAGDGRRTRPALATSRRAAASRGRADSPPSIVGDMLLRVAPTRRASSRPGRSRRCRRRVVDVGA